MNSSSKIIKAPEFAFFSYYFLTQYIEFTTQYTVDLVILACLNFRESLIMGLFTKIRIREFSFFFSSSITNNNFREILEFANLSSSRNSRKLKPREYYQIYSI